MKDIVEGLSNITKFIRTKIPIFSKDKNSLNYKFLIIGDKSVGKSSFVSKVINNKFSLEIKPSTETEISNLKLQFGNDKINIFLLDVLTSELSNNHGYLFHGINGAFILYDITKKDTFDKINNYVSDVKGNLGNEAPIVIIGNKKDLGHLREIHEIQLKEKSCHLNCDYYETSCVDENSVFDIVKFLVLKAYYNSLPLRKQNEIKRIFQE